MPKRTSTERRDRPTTPKTPSPAYHEGHHNLVAKYFADRGVRETIESVLVAVMLALLFRAFEAEAFVIPTGSMAPTLMGRHKDVQCDQCKYWYRTGASEENEDRREGFIMETVCPICHYSKLLNPEEFKNELSFSGDRILVDKLAYAFSPPNRWDVIVFKYPGNAKQNYIKRLIGLPGEQLRIRQGDIYVAAAGSDEYHIQSKDHRKLRAMLYLVDDTHHIPDALVELDWPSRWNEWASEPSQREWEIDHSDDHPEFSCESSGEQVRWLRYRHIVPHPLEWEMDIAADRLPNRLNYFEGELIGDYYAYNDNFVVKQPNAYRRNRLRMRDDLVSNADETLIPEFRGPIYQEWNNENRRQRLNRRPIHWVGDLAIEADVEVEQEGGTLLLDLVEGGVHFQCSIDLSNGNVTISANDNSVQFVGGDGETLTELTGQTSVDGTGRYRLRFANADDRIYFWVNNRPIELSGSGDYLRSTRVLPRFFPDDPSDAGDAEPLGVGIRDGSVSVSRLRVLRDIYYTIARMSTRDRVYDYTVTTLNVEGESLQVNRELIRAVMETPDSWESEALPLFQSIADESRDVTLQDDQFYPLGDNSPASQDARSWPYREKFIEGDDLLGKALFVYWPHSWNRPIPFMPNFRRMGFIR